MQKKRTIRKQPAQPFSFDLIEIDPITENQVKAFEAFDDGKNLFLYGSAGTGKSFISLYLALEEYFEEKKYKKIILVRSIVPGRDIGYLPGNLREKTEIYEKPYGLICNELLHRGDAYDILKNKFIIEFETTSFLRSITWKDAIVIVDEIQNMTKQEIYSCLTRIGENCRVILCGDYRQVDLKHYEQSWILELLEIIQRMNSFETIKFDVQDIVRSGFVKEFLIAKEEYENEESIRLSSNI